MKALILSAGYGERLRPVTDSIPKPLVEIGGRPLIHYPLLMLRHAGIRNIVLNVHHLAGMLEMSLGRGDVLGLEIMYSPEPMLLGTGGPLLALRDYFGHEPFIILNCDTIMELDMHAMVTAHYQRGALATLALRDIAESNAYSRVEIDSTGLIRRMRLLKDRTAGEFEDFPLDLPPDVATGIKPLMYCGAMVCGPEILELLPTMPPIALIKDLIAPLVAQKLPVCGHLQSGFFCTIDDLNTYQQLRREFASTIPPLSYLQRR